MKSVKLRTGVSFAKGAGVVAILILMSACSSTASTVSKTTGKTGGVVTFAEQPGFPPNYILPLESGEYASNATAYQFSNEMWLPLYWFGHNGLPVLNKSLSVAHPPIFSKDNTQVTITLKHWLWSNGQPITARDVMLWMNLLSAVSDPLAPSVGSSSAPGPGWFGVVPGYFPQNVISYSAPSTYTLSFKLNHSYNPTWFLYNELSQAYPLPQAQWDKLAPGGSVGNHDVSAQAREVAPTSAGLPANSYLPVAPGTANSGALGVAEFLNRQSQHLATYTSNPLWKVVDGPFRLTQYTSSGFVKLVPNATYSGSPKPKISAFEELPFTSAAAEFNAVENGSLTIGYVPPEDASTIHGLEKSYSYKVSPWYGYGFNYAGYNYTSPTLGPVFDQLYFRQAFQSLIDQPEYIKAFLAGYGIPTNGSVPAYPSSNPYLSPLVKGKLLYPYDPKKAAQLLSGHGWTVVPGGTSYCSSPGTGSTECGAGVKKGLALNIPLLYGSGNAALANEVEAMQSSMQSAAGIKLELSSDPIATITAISYDSCTMAKPCANWAMVATSTFPAWTYSPSFLPTGEELFVPGAASNLGNFADTTVTAAIGSTNTADTSKAEVAAIFAYENLAAKELPRAFMPMGPWQITVYKSDLSGLVPQDPSIIIYPQRYHFKK
jgi:peptide/nickel transport system substrate-binding protein